MAGVLTEGKEGVLEGKEGREGVCLVVGRGSSPSLKTISARLQVCNFLIIRKSVFTVFCSFFGVFECFKNSNL